MKVTRVAGGDYAAGICSATTDSRQPEAGAEGVEIGKVNVSLARNDQLLASAVKSSGVESVEIVNGIDVAGG